MTRGKEPTCDAIRKSWQDYEMLEGAIDRPLFSRIGARVREQRSLGPEDLFVIVAWKSMGRMGIALGNARAALRRNRPDDILTVTQGAFDLIADDDSEESAVAAIELLCSLTYVKVAIASAILTFYDPTRFGAIDPNAWKALGWRDDGEDFEPEDYGRYLKRIRELARQCRLTPRQVDAALYQIGSG